MQGHVGPLDDLRYRCKAVCKPKNRNTDLILDTIALRGTSGLGRGSYFDRLLHKRLLDLYIAQDNYREAMITCLKIYFIIEPAEPPHSHWPENRIEILYTLVYILSISESQLPDDDELRAVAKRVHLQSAVKLTREVKKVFGAQSMVAEHMEQWLWNLISSGNVDKKKRKRRKKAAKEEIGAWERSDERCPITGTRLVLGTSTTNTPSLVLQAQYPNPRSVYGWEYFFDEGAMSVTIPVQEDTNGDEHENKGPPFVRYVDSEEVMKEFVEDVNKLLKWAGLDMVLTEAEVLVV